MTQEDKQLLLKDLCARLPYGVKLDNGLKLRSIDVLTKVVSCSGSDRRVDYVRPYLRPMSSMTDEEKERLQSLHDIISNENYGDGYSPSAWDAITEWEDYCNSKHLDYCGLIPMDLALEAPEEMYKDR